jgi:hypothetical protein
MTDTITVWPQSTKPYRSNPPQGTAGLVMTVRDNLKFFKLAFHSIMDFTDYRFMLTVVDNMSLFSTRQYLDSLRRNHPVNVLQYQQTHSQGAEWNLGLRYMFAFANVEYGIVLTPDVVVEPNWLSRLARSLSLEDDLAWPLSNSRIAGGDAKPFCTGFKRAAYERLAGFDEVFHEAGPCMSDFAERAKKAGLRASCETQVYVHQFERNGCRPDPEQMTQDTAYLEAKMRTVPA